MENRTVVVVGGGHAGVEAALAAVRVGASAVLVTAEPSAIAVMPCNPAIGGVAKGCLVREIDALGGVMGLAADYASLQFRMLNLSKGPAVWGPRVQADSGGYPGFVRSALTTAGVSIVEGMARSLCGGSGRFTAVDLEDGRSIPGDAFVLATGTYLGGVLFRGGERWPGGRAGGLSSVSLGRFLSGLFHVERFKTGTSPRVVTRTVKTDALEVQSAHTFPFRFSLESDSPVRNSMLCHLARTNERTGRAILENLDRSPLYGKRIEGRGPRYCPSYETKVVKFPERHEHPVHLEPLSPESRLSYLNGLSTSMPQDVQYRMLRTIKGLENVEIALFGYAVEYSRLAWGEFDMSLRLSGTENLFAAGQILGTSGYEEAAALGLLAGANAARTAMDQGCVVPDREESYLGVMVSDLVRKGIDEPYRLFSSRAENRLHLRQDNAHARLEKLARDLGVLRGRRLSLVEDHLKQYKKAHELIRTAGLESLCRRPEASPSDVMKKDSRIGGLNPECVETAFNDIKYDGYISRHTRRRKAVREHWDLPLPEGFRDVGISIEARQAIETSRPETIREAALLPGVRASDLEVLTLLALKNRCST
ncbi:MAG: FAD-dependent oxidoreductase [Candidatus Fermentibacteraceae bacterium]